MAHSYKVADSRLFLKLLLKSKRLSPKEFRQLKQQIDPEGIHVIWLSMLHNDIEVRAMWYVKLAGSDEPHKMSFEIPLADFNKLPVHEAVAAGDE